MTTEELHDYYGSWAELARSLGMGFASYQNWLKKGYIPYTTQLLIEKKTEGRFIADPAHGRPLQPKNGPKNT